MVLGMPKPVYWAFHDLIKQNHKSKYEEAERTGDWSIFDKTTADAKIPNVLFERKCHPDRAYEYYFAPDGSVMGRVVPGQIRPSMPPKEPALTTATTRKRKGVDTGAIFVSEVLSFTHYSRE